jgi:site-specific DNA recombinase
MPNRFRDSVPVRAGVYTRISWDPAGQGAGVERQRLDCQALCAARGWDIAQYFEDNDASAYSGKPRRAYERMMSAVGEGALDAIVTWHNDRLHRSPRELETFIDLVEHSGLRVAVVAGGDYDLTTPDGRFTARIVGAVARKESEDRSRRVRRKHLELAEQGKPSGQLGWGVRDDAERELVREAARRVLAGQGLITIARDWNVRGVPGATGRPWTAPTLRKALLSARVAGLREHGADPSGKVLGALTPATWQRAIDRQTWDHVRSVLLNPERLTLRNTPTKYLLTGLIFCGVCGGRMLSRPRDAHTKRYVCAGRRPGHQLGILAPARGRTRGQPGTRPALDTRLSRGTADPVRTD